MYLNSTLSSLTWKNKRKNIHFYSAFILPRQIFYGWRSWEIVKTGFFQIVAEISSDVTSELFSGNWSHGYEPSPVMVWVMESQSTRWWVGPEGPIVKKQQKCTVPFLPEILPVLQLVSEPLVKSRCYPPLPYISASQVAQW